MAAALTSGGAHRSVLLLDAGEGRNAPADAFHCPYCHGHECTGKLVAVIGAEQARVWPALR
jgi:thioredoxin reductase